MAWELVVETGRCAVSWGYLCFLCMFVHVGFDVRNADRSCLALDLLSDRGLHVCAGFELLDAEVSDVVDGRC